MAIGRAPFNTAWFIKGGNRNPLYKKIFFDDKDQASLAIFQTWFFPSPILTKKKHRYWTGTEWKDMDAGYTPATSGHWNGAPAFVTDALDRIAAAVYVLRGNVPIP